MSRGTGHIWEGRVRPEPLLLTVLMPSLRQTRAVFMKPEGNQQAEVVIDPVGELLGCFETKLSAQHLPGNMLMVKKI